MKNIYYFINRITRTANLLYSILWIKVTGTDKWTYRDESRVHHFLIAAGSNAVIKARKLEEAEAIINFAKAHSEAV